MMMRRLKGIAASSGIAMGQAYHLVEPTLSINKKQINDAHAELERLRAAIKKAQLELEGIRDHAKKEVGIDHAAIFEAQLLILHDREFWQPIEDEVRVKFVNAEYALKEMVACIIAQFKTIESEYLQERAADIHDVTNRILVHLLGATSFDLKTLTEEVIIVADDLTPSDTAQLNRQFVKGFITNKGGRTSHTAIMANSMEIPAIVGTKQATVEIENGDYVIVDAIRGIIMIDPSEELIQQYHLEKREFEAQKTEWTKLVHERTRSKDGHPIELAANIEAPNDLDSVIQNGGEGIGLFRTEFLYMGKEQLPTEEEQFAAYKAVLKGMKGKPVIIRTLDIGGDKELSTLQLPHEENPFLGLRAIRLSLKEEEIFRTQLCALLRASMYGNLKIMFPMIATIHEFRQAKAIFSEEREQLLNKGVAVSENIEVGIMVEIPAVALLADQFAKEVDFFSIGTNDLIQYTMAADRLNERVAYLYQPYNPAILRLVKMVIAAAEKERKWTSMCGEMASDELAIPLLLGLGLKKFSLNVISILKIRSQIGKLNKSELEKMATQALQLATMEEVIDMMMNWEKSK